MKCESCKATLVEAHCTLVWNIHLTPFKHMLCHFKTESDRKKKTAWRCHPTLTSCRSVEVIGKTDFPKWDHRPQKSDKVTDISPLCCVLLTDFQLPLYSFHVSIPVLSLDGVTVAHELHKLLGQDRVLAKGERKKKEAEWKNKCSRNFPQNFPKTSCHFHNEWPLQITPTI